MGTGTLGVRRSVYPLAWRMLKCTLFCMVDHLSYYSFFFFYFSCIIFIFSFLVIHPWVVLPRDSWGFVLETFGVRLVYEVPHAFFGCYARLAPLLSLGWIWYCALCTLINHTGCFWEDRWESGGRGTEVSYFDSFFSFLMSFT